MESQSRPDAVINPGHVSSIGGKLHYKLNLVHGFAHTGIYE